MAEEEPIVDAGEEVAEEVEAAEEDEFVPTTGATDVKLFGKWSFDDIEVSDLSLEVSAATSVINICCSGFALCFGIAYRTFIAVNSGLHCLQGRSCHLFATHGWTVPKEAFPKGLLPHR